MKHKEIVAYAYPNSLNDFITGTLPALTIRLNKEPGITEIKIIVPIPERQVLISESEFEKISLGLVKHGYSSGDHFEIVDIIRKRFEL